MNFILELESFLQALACSCTIRLLGVICLTNGVSLMQELGIWAALQFQLCPGLRNSVLSGAAGQKLCHFLKRFASC